MKIIAIRYLAPDVLERFFAPDVRFGEASWMFDEPGGMFEVRCLLSV